MDRGRQQFSRGVLCAHHRPDIDRENHHPRGVARGAKVGHEISRSVINVFYAISLQHGICLCPYIQLKCSLITGINLPVLMASFMSCVDDCNGRFSAISCIYIYCTPGVKNCQVKKCVRKITNCTAIHRTLSKDRSQILQTGKEDKQQDCH